MEDTILAAIADKISAERSDLLRRSLDDAIAYVGHPSLGGNTAKSEQTWFSEFSSGVCSSATFRAFVNEFQLSRASWEHDAASQVVTAMIGSSAFTPTRDVPALSKALSLLTKRGHQQTSAASKLSMFARPEAPVFIWDQLATRSARLRQWEAAGRVGRCPLKMLYSIDKQHDYAAYAAACMEALNHERTLPDFVSAVDQYERVVRKEGGAMSDTNRATREYLERRYLDKLMFWEGYLIRAFHESKVLS